MLCLSATMAKGLSGAFYSIREEHMLSKGNRSNVCQSHGEMGAPMNVIIILEKLVADLHSIGGFGRRDFEVKRKYKYMPNPKDEMGTGGKMQQREDDHDKTNKADQTEVENIMKAAQIHLVVATLIMTVTFTAGFTLPGGFDSDPDSPNKGMAILLRRTAFCAFVVTDAIAFTSSAIAVFTYFAMAASGISVTGLKVVDRLYKIATFLQLVAMSAVVIAFVTGMYATLAHSVGLAATVCVIGCISFIMYVCVTGVLGSSP